MFQQTINLGKELRPNALWGFYGFPDCYGNKGKRYQCSDQVKRRNDKLDWLYDSSTALFPSMYLLEEHPDNRDYVLGRLRETLRFVERGIGKTRTNIPVFVYHRNIYERDPFAFNFLSTKDLSNTIGLAADIGAAGIVIWGNRFDENTSPHVCQMINEYVHDTLGPYIQNKMHDVDKCSARHCGYEGHCIDRFLLPPGVVRHYENQEKLNLCFKPVETQSNYKRDSVVHFANFTHHNQATFSGVDYLSTDVATKKGELGDIGASTIHRKRLNVTIMDDFFRQMNGTSSRVNDVMGTSKNFSYNTANNKTNRKNSTKPKYMEHSYSNTTKRTTSSQPTVPSQQSNFTKLIESEHKTLSSNMSTSVNKTNRVSNRTEFKLGKNEILHNNNVRKSSIPHPPSKRNPSFKQYHHPVSANQKKSDITQELLGGMSGSMIRIADLFGPENPKKRSNTTTHKGVENTTSTNTTGQKQNNNSRKSEIYKTSGGNLPLMSSQRNHHTWLPHIYVILIAVSLGGALLFSLVFIGAYYYVSLKNTFPSHHSEQKMFHDENIVKSPSFPPQAHSSPKGGETLKLEKKHKLIETRSVGSKGDVYSTESMNICESKCDLARKYNKHSYRRTRSEPDLDRKHDKLEKLDRRRLRNKSSNLPSRDEEVTEIEININDLVK